MEGYVLNGYLPGEREGLADAGETGLESLFG
jgi:hypothetical protein